MPKGILRISRSRPKLVMIKIVPKNKPRNRSRIDVRVHRQGFPEANLIPEEISFLCFTRPRAHRTIGSSQRKLIFFASLRIVAVQFIITYLLILFLFY